MTCIPAFATPNSSFGITFDQGSQDILKRLVSSAKKSGKGTKIVLSIGTIISSFRYVHLLTLANRRWVGGKPVVLRNHEQLFQSNEICQRSRERSTYLWLRW